MKYPPQVKRKPLTIRIRHAVMVRDNYTCVTCKTSCMGEYLEIDHIVAWWCGGTNSVDNLQTLCKPCHRAKSAIDNRAAKKAARIRKKNDGEWRQNRQSIGDSKWKKKVSGETVLRDTDVYTCAPMGEPACERICRRTEPESRSCVRLCPHSTIQPPI